MKDGRVDAWGLVTQGHFSEPKLSRLFLFCQSLGHDFHITPVVSPKGLPLLVTN